ncbi:PLP-dependent transferase [Bradyrhizobium sp. WSM4349]
MPGAPFVLKRRLQRGVGDDLIRLSVGLEDEADLLGDLEQSLTRL